MIINQLMWQTLATCIVAIISYFLAGKAAAISAGLGGFSIVFATAIASLVYVRNRNKSDATAVLVTLITAELVKLAFVFTILFLVFKQYKTLVPAALIAGLIAAAVLSGVSISKQKL